MTISVNLMELANSYPIFGVTVIFAAAGSKIWALIEKLQTPVSKSINLLSLLMNMIFPSC